jgi:hypothetical protein
MIVYEPLVSTPILRPTAAITIWITPRAFRPAPSAMASCLLRPLSQAPANAPVNLPTTATTSIATALASTTAEPSTPRFIRSPAVAKKMGAKMPMTTDCSGASRTRLSPSADAITTPQLNAPNTGSSPSAPAPAAASRISVTTAAM